MSDESKPTAKQQRYLRELAQRTGTSFTPPATRREASREIARLKNHRRSSGYERAEDRKAIADGMDRRGGAAAVGGEEIVGYGSTAHWRDQ